MDAGCSNSRPNKRQRTDGEDVSGFVKDADVWLPDGNVVVVAQNVAFRVFRSVLAHHSDVFRDLFSLPPTDVNDTFEGCPVVVLEGDDPDDLHHLFLVLCCGKK